MVNGICLSYAVFRAALKAAQGDHGPIFVADGVPFMVGVSVRDAQSLVLVIAAKPSTFDDDFPKVTTVDVITIT